MSGSAGSRRRLLDRGPAAARATLAAQRSRSSGRLVADGEGKAQSAWHAPAARQAPQVAHLRHVAHVLFAQGPAWHHSRMHDQQAPVGQVDRKGQLLQPCHVSGLQVRRPCAPAASAVAVAVVGEQQPLLVAAAGQPQQAASTCPCEQPSQANLGLTVSPRRKACHAASAASSWLPRATTAPSWRAVCMTCGVSGGTHRQGGGVAMGLQATRLAPSHRAQRSSCAPAATAALC